MGPEEQQLLPPQQSNRNCQEGWRAGPASCVRVFDVESDIISGFRLTYEVAKARCRTASAELVSINDGVDNQFIASLIGDRYAYIGLKAQDGTLRWDNGLEATYEAEWHGRKSSAGRKSCVR